MSHDVPRRGRAAIAFIALILAFRGEAIAQANATLQGWVADSSGAGVPAATILVRHRATSAERRVASDPTGHYQIAALSVGDYRIEVRATGFRTEVVESFVVEVAGTFIRDFHLQVGDIAQDVVVVGEASLTERGTISVGEVIGQRRVQEIPLNGRHFVDLGLLVPGSVTPPQNGFLTSPNRGQGALAFNTAGNREDTVNYMINGININDQFNDLVIQPSITSVQEFKVHNSTFSAEYGRNSGAIVNIATRSGSNQLHGEAFEFFRNDTLDARNFFTLTSPDPPPFTRHQFGGHLGGPLARDATFFFAGFEGLRQRQELAINSVVPSDAERASVTEPVVASLIALLPHANLLDEGTSRFVGTASAPVDADQWSLDVSHSFTTNVRLHGYYTYLRDERLEPTFQGNTVPAFGDTRGRGQHVLTLNELHVFGPTLVNEARVGFNRNSGDAVPNAALNPADFGIDVGIDQPIGLPQMAIAGAFNFGGPARFPVERTSTTAVVSDTLSHLRGRHSLKVGGELRRFLNRNVGLDPGTFNFPSVPAFLAGRPNAFSVMLGARASNISQGALGFFVQDHLRVRPTLTLELGLRYEWNMTPTEADDRLIVFDAASSSLRRAGTGIYHQNNRNFQPRLGVVWDPAGTGRTVVRAAYASAVNQPTTSVVAGTSTNPPLATPLTVTGDFRLDNAATRAVVAGLAPTTVDPAFDNPVMRLWNVNVQQALGDRVAVMVGYFGSHGRQLQLARNINQPVDGVRPFVALSPSSPILPGTPLGNITQIESTGRSGYHAFWLSANQRLFRGLQWNASYVWSKAIDYNSLSSQGIVVQNSYDVANDRGLADFDARHRVVVSAIYDLPFRGHPLFEGWRLAVIVQSQSGNPVNIVTSDSSVTGVANTLRPDATGRVQIVGDVDRWFDTSVFTPVRRFGSLGRNVIIGPRFDNTDVSVSKLMRIGSKLRSEFRIEIFDVFNHPNFGQPGRVVDSPDFGRITSTRFPTGDAGSSRQIQLAVKLSF